MKELHNYLSALGFDCTTPGTNHFYAFLKTENREVKALYLDKFDNGEKNLLVMDVFKSETSYSGVIAMQSIATPKILHQHMLNSYRLKELCPVLYQKILETPE